jgi:hypothetical protein
VPTLSPGNVIIIDNFGFHKSERAELVSQRRQALPAENSLP